MKQTMKFGKKINKNLDCCHFLLQPAHVKYKKRSERKEIVPLPYLYYYLKYN